MKQGELAQRCGKSIQTISAIERGAFTRTKTIESIASVFGVSPDVLRDRPPMEAMLNDENIDDLARIGRIIGIISRIAARDPVQTLPLLSALQRIPVQPYRN